jgi:hypothetical protein
VTAGRSIDHQHHHGGPLTTAGRSIDTSTTTAGR